jgi:hypothetical protein
VMMKRMFGLAGAVGSAALAGWINENAAQTAVISVEVLFIKLKTAAGREVAVGSGTSAIDLNLNKQPPCCLLEL